MTEFDSFTRIVALLVTSAAGFFCYGLLKRMDAGEDEYRMFTLNPPLSIFVRAIGFGFAGYAIAVILKRTLILLGVWEKQSGGAQR